MLIWKVDELIADDPNMERRCTFLPPSRVDQGGSELINLSSLLEEAALQLRKDVPLELVVNMFQKLVRAMSTQPTFPAIESAHAVYPATEPTTYPVFTGRKADGHGHQDGHRVATHLGVAYDTCRRARREIQLDPNASSMLCFHVRTIYR